MRPRQGRIGRLRRFHSAPAGLRDPFLKKEGVSV